MYSRDVDRLCLPKHITAHDASLRKARPPPASGAPREVRVVPLRVLQQAHITAQCQQPPLGRLRLLQQPVRAVGPHADGRYGLLAAKLRPEPEPAGNSRPIETLHARFAHASASTNVEYMSKAARVLEAGDVLPLPVSGPIPINWQRSLFHASQRDNSYQKTDVTTSQPRRAPGCPPPHLPGEYSVKYLAATSPACLPKVASSRCCRT